MSESMPLVSVVICAYNVEQYIDKCVSSVMCQTYRNLEILCVDDCSTDKTREKLQELAKADSRIRVIAQTVNGGRSEARNAGLKAATGEYISFIDGDDEIKPQTYERLLPCFSSGIDVVWFGIDIVYEAHEEMRESDAGYYRIKDAGMKTIGAEDLLDYDCSCCNKIFRRSQIVPDLYFNGRYYEDALFFMKFFALPKNIYFVQDKLYVYYRHPVSIMSDTMNGVAEVSLHHIYILDNLFKYWTKAKILPEHNESFNKIFAAFFWLSFKYALPYEKALVIHEATKRLRKWDTGEYNDPLLDALHDGTYEIKFGSEAVKTLRKLRGFEKVFCMRNENGHKVIRLFKIKIASYKKR